MLLIVRAQIRLEPIQPWQRQIGNATDHIVGEKPSAAAERSK